MNVQKYWSTHVTPILQQMADCVINVFTFWHSRRARRKGDPQGGGGVCKDGVPKSKAPGTSPGNGPVRSSSVDEAHGGPGCRGLEMSVCDSICGGDFGQIVKLPPLLDLNEWLASHCLAFFNHINLLYSSVSCQFCTAESCPVMTGPGNVQYPWLDERGKKMKCSGPQYVDYVMSNIQELVRGEETFPTKYGNAFPANADATFRRISRLLWHVLSHMYSSHWMHFASIGLSAQLTTVTEHFVAFCAEFDLITDSKESAAMAEIVQHIRVIRQASAALSMELSTSSAPSTTSESQLAEFTKAGDTNLLLADSGEDKAGGGGISPSASSDAGISDNNSESRQLIPSTTTQQELLSEDRLHSPPVRNRTVDREDEDSDDGNRYLSDSRRTTMDVEAVINASPPQLTSSSNSSTTKGGSPTSPPPPNYPPPPPMRDQDYLNEDPSFFGQNDCDNTDQFSPEGTLGLEDGRNSSEGLDMDLTLAPTAIPNSRTNSLRQCDVNFAESSDSPFLDYQSGIKTTENTSYYPQNCKDNLSGYVDNIKSDSGMANASYNSSMIDSGFIDTTTTISGSRWGDPSPSAASTPEPPLPRGGSGNFRIAVPSNPFGGHNSTPTLFSMFQKSPQRQLIDNQSPHRHGFPKIRSLSRSSRNNCDISDHKTSVALDSTSKPGVQLTSASPISRMSGTSPQSHYANSSKVPPIVDNVGTINPQPTTSDSDGNGGLCGPGHAISPSTPSGSAYLPQSCDIHRTPLIAEGEQVAPVWTGGKNFDSAIASQSANSNYSHHLSSDNKIDKNDAATSHIGGSSRGTNFTPAREDINPIGPFVLPIGVGGGPSGGPLLDSMLTGIHPGSRGSSLGGLTVDTTVDYRYLTSASERVDPLNLDPKRVGFSAEETRRDNFCERHLNQSLNQANSRYHRLSANQQNRAISSSSSGCRGDFGDHSGNGSPTNFPLAVSMSGSPVKRGKESVGTVGNYFGRGCKEMTLSNQDGSTSSTFKSCGVLLDGTCPEDVGNNENFALGLEVKGEPRVEGRVGGRRSRTATGSRSSGKGSSADSVTSQSSIPLVEMQA